MKDTLSVKAERHRGANGDMVEFARRFVTARMKGFTKDIRICLTPVPSETRPGNTHAYFPALMSCLTTLEYMTQLHLGRTVACSDKEIRQYCQKFMPASYNADVLRVLFEAFRHPIAHRGISSGVWVDEDRRRPQRRRITWTVTEKTEAPAISIVEHAGIIKRDAPWECSHTHRAVIRIGQLAADIRESALGAQGYCAQLSTNKTIIRNFTTCMKELYPL